MARPVGVKETKPRNTASRKWSAELAASGTTPVQFLQRALWEQERIIDDEESTEDQRKAAWVFGVAIAEKVAPYLAPRLSAIAHSGPDGEALSPPTLIINGIAAVTN